MKSGSQRESADSDGSIWKSNAIVPSHENEKLLAKPSKNVFVSQRMTMPCHLWVTTFRTTNPLITTITLSPLTTTS